MASSPLAGLHASRVATAWGLAACISGAFAPWRVAQDQAAAWPWARRAARRPEERVAIARASYFLSIFQAAQKTRGLPWRDRSSPAHAAGQHPGWVAPTAG